MSIVLLFTPLTSFIVLLCVLTKLNEDMMMMMMMWVQQTIRDITIQPRFSYCDYIITFIIQYSMQIRQFVTDTSGIEQCYFYNLSLRLYWYVVTVLEKTQWPGLVVLGSRHYWLHVFAHWCESCWLSCCWRVGWSCLQIQLLRCTT